MLLHDNIHANIFCRITTINHIQSNLYLRGTYNSYEAQRFEPTQQQRIAQTNNIMNKLITVFLIILSFQETSAQELHTSDTLYFEYNTDYLKEISINYGNKKDRLYLKATPEIQGNFFFEIQGIQKNSISPNTQDFKDVLIDNNLLISEDNLYLKTLKFWKFLRGKTLFFVKKNAEHYIFYEVIGISEEI